MRRRGLLIHAHASVRPLVTACLENHATDLMISCTKLHHDMAKKSSKRIFEKFLLLSFWRKMVNFLYI